MKTELLQGDTVGKVKDFPTMILMVTDKSYSETDGFYEQIVSNDGKPFNMLEEGNVFVALKKEGESEASIAKRIGKSGQHVHNCLLLAYLPKEIKAYIVNDIIKPTLMLELIHNYPNIDELQIVINEKLQNKQTIADNIETAEKQQSAIPFNDGSIDTEKGYELPEKKKCTLKPKDFKIPPPKNYASEITPNQQFDSIIDAFVSAAQNLQKNKDGRVINEDKVSLLTSIIEVWTNGGGVDEITELFYE